MGGGGSTPESFDRAASTKRADLVRQQWSDYQTRFQPVENQVIADMGTGIHTNFNGAGLANARKGVEASFGSATAAADQDRARYGLGLNDMQKQANSTQTNIAKTAASANATNTASQWDIDRRNAVMSGGLGEASAIGRK